MKCCDDIKLPLDISLWKEHHLPLPPLDDSRGRREDSEAPSQKSPSIYFCDWYPHLFGIDEDEIPSSEDEEGRFYLHEEGDEEAAKRLTQEELQGLRVGDWRCLTDEELREAWLKDRQPKYGRRARQKPILCRETGERFTCICDIDWRYCRHYVPNFGGGVAKEGEELRIPHFKAFWQEYHEKAEMGGLDRLSKIFYPDKDSRPTPPLPHHKYPGSCKKVMQKFRKELLSTFRPLECRDVRRYRMPYSEALYLELQEDDCLNGAEFFKYLIVKDYFKQKASSLPRKASLRRNKHILNKIYEILKIAERFARNEEYHKEAYVYLRTGKYFYDHEEIWWWLTEEFYTKAVKVSQHCVIDGGQAEAIANYILGRFLLDYAQEVQPAEEHLLRARELSQGKDWSARNILETQQETVHRECATYLCRALIATSKELRKMGKPEEALPLIHRSYKLCEELDSSRVDIEMETYFELGMTYQAVGMLDWAKTAFSKFIEKCQMQNHVKGICDGYLEMAICHKREGDLDRCLRSLTSFLNTAKMRENENLIAFGQRYLGEFHLNNGNPDVAVGFFRKAFDSFHKQMVECKDIPFGEWGPEHFTLPSDVELTRVLLGLAQGETLTKPICSLILDSRDEGNKLLKLIEWKNDPEKFKLEDLVDKPVESPKSSEMDVWSSEFTMNLTSLLNL